MLPRIEVIITDKQKRSKKRKKCHTSILVSHCDKKKSWKWNKCTLSASRMLTEIFTTLMNASSNIGHRKRTENAIKENKRAATHPWIDRKRFIFLMKHERRQNGALVSFIGYKGTADWLLARILKWIADRLILYPNHRSIERRNETSRMLSWIWRLPIGSKYKRW